MERVEAIFRARVNRGRARSRLGGSRAPESTPRAICRDKTRAASASVICPRPSSLRARSNKAGPSQNVMSTGNANRSISESVETPSSRSSLATPCRSLAEIRPMRHRASTTSRSTLIMGGAVRLARRCSQRGTGQCRGRPSKVCSGRVHSPTGCAPPDPQRASRTRALA